MTKLSVTASRVLMGLGVIGIASSAFGADAKKEEAGKTIIVDNGGKTEIGLVEFKTPGNKITFTGNGTYDAQAGMLIQGKEEGEGKNKKATVAELTVQGSATQKGKFKIGTTSGNLEFGGHSHLALNDIDLTLKADTNMSDSGIANGTGILFFGTNNTLTLQNTILTPQMAEDANAGNYMFGSATGGDLTIELGEGGYINENVNIDGYNTAGIIVDGLANGASANLTIKGLLAGGNKLNESNKLTTILLSGLYAGPSSLTLDNIGGADGLEIGTLTFGNGYDKNEESANDSFRVVNGSNVKIDNISFEAEDIAEIYIEKSKLELTADGSFDFGGIGSDTVIAIKDGSEFIAQDITDLKLAGSIAAGELTFDLSASDKKGSKEGVMRAEKLQNIYIGDSWGGAKLKFIGAHNVDEEGDYDKASANIKFHDDVIFNLGINTTDEDRGSTYIFDNSKIRAQVKLINNTGEKLSNNAIILQNKSIFILDEKSPKIQITEKNPLTIELSQWSNFISEKDIEVSSDSGRAELTLKGNNEDVNFFYLSEKNGKGTLELKFGNAIKGSTLNVNQVTAYLDKLNITKAGGSLANKDSKHNEINVLTGKMEVVGKTTIASDIRENTQVFNLDDGKVWFKGGFEGKGISDNGAKVTFNFKNYDFNGWTNVSEVMIGGKGSHNINGATYNLHFESYADLMKENITLVRLTDKGATFEKGKIGTLNENIKFDIDGTSLSPLLWDGDFKLTFNVKNSEVAKIENSSYEIKIADGNKVNFVVSSNANVSIEDKLWAQATDLQRYAGSIITGKVDEKLEGTLSQKYDEKIKALEDLIAGNSGDTDGNLEVWKQELDKLKKAKVDIEKHYNKGKEIKKGQSIDYYVKNTAMASNANKSVMDKALNVLKQSGNGDLASRLIFGNRNLDSSKKDGISDVVKLTSSLENARSVKDANAILGSIASNKNIGDLEEIATLITNPHFFKDTRKAGLDANMFSDSSSSATTAVNVSNDMAIGNRIARFNNPYLQNDVKRFASLDSDASFDYYENYKTSLWANAFGGMTLIDGNNGGVYGVTGGVDGNLSDEFLLGAYATYSNATLKADSIEQQSDNFQLGAYALYKFAPTWELNLKASVQLGLADQDRSVRNGGTYSSDFTRRFLMLGGNVGKVFNVSQGFYVKPFAGLNYYYSYTPDYSESGLGQRVNEQTNNSISLEAGAEFRAYLSEISYIYVTPKIEQYVMNSGDDYTAKFAGATTTFTLNGDESKKTYGQLIIGGNYDVDENLSVNAGVGVKQILAGKVHGNDETYLTGNLGAKYKF